MRFRYRDNLIYYLDKKLDDNREHLCIFRKLVDDIFALIYDRLNYDDFHKIYNRIIASFYIRKLIRLFQIYITHYSQYQLNQTIRYLFYEILRFIQLSTILFYIIAINFILTLFITIENNFNTILIMICKFSKQVILIFDKNI